MAETLTGTGVSPGLAVGPVARMVEAARLPAEDDGPAAPADPGAELGRARAALVDVAADLEARGRVAGGEARGILEAQALMARDPGLADELTRRVHDGGLRAAPAVREAFGVHRELLAGAGEYVAGRVADLDDVRDRVLARLHGVEPPRVPDPGHPFVLVARDLAPADTATLTPGRVLALVTQEGGPTSHTAILARALGVPAVVGCAGAAALADGTRVLVDGGAGRVVAEPGEEQARRAARLAAARRGARRRARGPGATGDGHRVGLLANVGGVGDLEPARDAGAEGVGLLRTEFLFLDRREAPGVDEQARAYAGVLRAFPGGRVVVRVLDAGADKPLPFLDLGPEPNPALGRRGLRALRLRPVLLDDQVEAIVRAAGEAGPGVEVWVMAPMVATAEEAAWFCRRARRDPITRAGVMVELPAAALAAPALLVEADFASLGTNDLAQYAFGADRQVAALAGLQDPWQPALLQLVALTAGAGRSAGRPVGVCGEAAGDPALALVLTGLGVTSLSMAPPAIADVRAALARHTLDRCRSLAELALAAPSAAAGRERVRAAAPELAELGL